MMRSKKFLRMAGATAVSFALVASSVSLASQAAYADPIGDNECYPAVLMLRGSDEPQLSPNPASLSGKIEYVTNANNEPIILTNGHEGERISRILTSFVSEASADDLATMSKLRFIGIDYDAYKALPELPDPSPFQELNSVAPGTGLPAYAGATATHVGFHVGALIKSMDGGAKATVNIIDQDIARGCHTQYMLVGYSQGVLAARIAANMLDNDLKTVVSSYSIGDPFQDKDRLLTANQVSPAHSGAAGDGVLRTGFDLAKGLAILNGHLNPSASIAAVNGINHLEASFGRSDSLIYRDDSSSPSGTYSRSLCHENDFVCSFPSLTNFSSASLNSHENYYQAGVTQGDLDLSEERPRFAAQLANLADSQTFDPRERVLTKNQGAIGIPTTYRIHQARVDDDCEWDIGSDGTYDTPKVKCIDRFEHTPEASSEKMTVRVTDSFDQIKVLSIEEETVDSEAIQAFVGFPEDKWSSFIPFGPNPNYCIKHNISMSSTIDWDSENSSWHSLEKGYNESDCGREPSTGGPYDGATSVVKYSSIQTPTGLKNRIVSGYDDDYSWTVKPTDSTKVILKRTDANADQNAEVTLQRIVNNTPYYSITVGNSCLAADVQIINGWWGPYEETNIILLPCDADSTAQLFRAIDAKGNYGAHSVEKDITPPSDLKGLEFRWTPENGYHLYWLTSKDSRVPWQYHYKIYKMNPLTQEYEFVERIFDGSWNTYYEHPLDVSQLTPGANNQYKVTAMDESGNESVPGYVSFITP